MTCTKSNARGVRGVFWEDANGQSLSSSWTRFVGRRVCVSWETRARAWGVRRGTYDASETCATGHVRRLE